MVSEERERERESLTFHTKRILLYTQQGEGEGEGERECFGKCFLNSNENNVIEGLLNDLAGDLSYG